MFGSTLDIDSFDIVYIDSEGDEADPEGDAPLAAGEYDVLITRPETEGYQAFSVLIEKGLVITKRPVYLEGITFDKIYDGTEDVPPTLKDTLDDIKISDGGINDGIISVDKGKVSLVTPSGLDEITAKFDCKNVGTDKPVAITGGLLLVGDPSDNYVLVAFGNVEKKSIEVETISVKDKEYDGTTSAAVDVGNSVFIGGISTDDIAIAVTATFKSKDVGVDIDVLLGTPTLTGNDKDNYYILSSYPTETKANIDPRIITITPNAGQSKVFGITNDPPFTFGISGHISTATPDTGAVLTAISREPGDDVGFYAFSVDENGAGTNYILSKGGTYGFEITHATLSIAHQEHSVRFTDLVQQIVNIATLVDNYKGTGALNYGIGTPTGTTGIWATGNGGVAPAINPSTGSLTFTLASGLSYSNQTTATIPITVSGFQNYTSPVTFNVVVKLTDRDVIAYTAPPGFPSGKTYDGTALGQPTATPTSTAANPEWTYTWSGTDDNNQGFSGNTPPVNPGRYQVSIAYRDDVYMVNPVTSGYIIIERANLSWNANGTVNAKPYDGTTTAAVAIQPTLTGLVSGSEEVTVTNGTVAFDNADAGDGKTINVGGTWGINGIHAWKYIAPTTAPAFSAGTITKKDISIQSVMISNKTFDNSAAVNPTTVTPTFTGQIASTSVAFTVTVAAITGGNHAVGNRPVSVTVALADAANTNYNLTNSPFTGTGATVNVIQAEGADAEILSITPTWNSLTVTHKPIPPSNTEQEIEFAIAEGNVSATPDSGWQTENVFTNLKPETTYTIFARVLATHNYLAGKSDYRTAPTDEIIPISSEEELRRIGNPSYPNYSLTGSYGLTASFTIVDPDMTIRGTFNGSFNGAAENGFYIVFNNAGQTQGLFEIIGTDGVVTNLTVKNINIDGVGSVGGIAGTNNGTINNCTVDGGRVSGRAFSTTVGGIAGINEPSGRITNCSAFNDGVSSETTGTGDFSVSLIGRVVGQNPVRTISGVNFGPGYLSDNIARNMDRYTNRPDAPDNALQDTHDGKDGETLAHLSSLIEELNLEDDEDEEPDDIPPVDNDEPDDSDPYSPDDDPRCLDPDPCECKKEDDDEDDDPDDDEADDDGELPDDGDVTDCVQSLNDLLAMCNAAKYV